MLRRLNAVASTISSPTVQSLAGKVAIVSGSSRGIGAAIARELAARGAHVVINYPNGSLVDEAQTTLSSLLVSGIAVEADLSTPEGPGKLVAAAKQKYDKIDILVNNAGVAYTLPLEESTLELWDKAINLNGRGSFLLTQAVLPHLAPKNSRIINIVPISARTPPPGQTLYAGSKAMVDAFTTVWSKELPPKYGCTVNSVSPGLIGDTTIYDIPEQAAVKARKPHYIAMIPCGKREGRPDEIAYAVAFLCEEQASWVCGAHLEVSGGIVAT